MPRHTARRIPNVAACLLLPLLSGCQLASFIFLCAPDDTKCTALVYAAGRSVYGCGFQPADVKGCITAPSGTGCDEAGQVFCGLVPLALYETCALCDDPVLAEWPDSWTVTSATWASAFPPPVSGALLIEPAENFALPGGVESIVTDPGYSAYVLRMDVTDAPEDTYVFRIEFERGDTEAQCVEGVEVALFTFEPGGYRFIAPLEGESFDFTTYTAPDPHVICISDPTPVHPSTWGWVKGLYR